MKILRRALGRDKSGFLKVECEQNEDLWHVYNLLREGDLVSAPTLRKVQHVSSTGTVSNSKERFTATLRCDKVEYETDSQIIRVKGVNVRECRHMSLGQSHSLELALNRAFSIEKERWDSMDLERIKIATDPSKNADCVVVSMDSNGLCNIILVSGHMTTIRTSINKSIPRKRMGSSSRHDKAVIKFYQLIMDAILKHIDFDVVKVIVLASPGFVKDSFSEWMWNEAGRGSEIHKILFANRSKFMTARVSGAHKGAVKEILETPEMSRVISDTKASLDMSLLDEFYKVLSVDESRAIYGFKFVESANRKRAIRTLMVTDALFRSADIKTRRQYIALVESAQRNGADVRIFSSLHHSGEQLDMLTGVAALLKYSMPELLELMVEEDDSEEGDSSDDESDVAVAQDTDDDYAALMGDDDEGNGDDSEGSSDDDSEVEQKRKDEMSAKKTKKKPVSSAAKQASAESGFTDTSSSDTKKKRKRRRKPKKNAE